MSNKSLETTYKGQVIAVKSIPTLPVALQKTMVLMDGNKTNLTRVAEIISQDQSLSTRVLKMVNSPVYGFPRRISSIHNALVLLGVNAIYGLLISTVVFDVVSKEMEGLWEHSLACSTACSTIAHILKIKEIEDCAIAGLLHDFGKVVIAVQLPEAMRDIENLIRNDDVLIVQAEKLMLGFNHTKVNAWVCAHWNLPIGITAAMTYHHSPMMAGNYITLAAVVHLGDFFARLFEMGNAGDENVPEIDPLVLKHLSLGQDSLRELVDRVGIALQSQGSFPVFRRR